MNAQIGQVLTTYWRRAFSSRFTLLVIAIPVVGMIEAVFLKKLQISIVIWFGIYVPALIAIHFKQQIIQIRQRRIPNAVEPHVVVAVGLLALCGLGIPAAILAFGIWSWGALGFICAVAAVTFTLFALQTGRILSLVMLLFLPACLNPVQHWLEQLCQGRHETFALPLLVAGICIIAATLTRLLQLSEEDAGFLDLLDSRTYLLSQPSTVGARIRPVFWLSPVARLMLWWMMPPEQQVQLWPQWARGYLWQRVKLWGVVLTGKTLWPFTVFFLAIFSAEYLWSSAAMRSRTMISNALFMIVYPIVCVVGIAWQQRQFTAIELLRPVGRSQFMNEKGLLFASRVAAAWVQFSIAWCVPALMFVSDTPVWSQQMFNLLLLSAACQVFFFGLAAWLIPHTGPYVLWLSLVGVCFVVIFPSLLTSYDWRSTSLNSLLWVAPAIFVAGALITWDAHRRWIQTELG